MNVRPVPARGGVAGRTSVNLRLEYIPEGKLAVKTNIDALPGAKSYSSPVSSIQFQPFIEVIDLGIRIR
jgi:hypothetical protein